MFLIVRHGFQLFLDAEQTGGDGRQRYADYVGYVLIAHVLQPKENDGAVEDIQSTDALVQLLNLLAVGVGIVVQVDIDRKRHRLYTTFLLPFLVVASIQADTPYPRLQATLAPEVLKTFPQVYQYLLEVVLHFVLVLEKK